MDGLKVFFATVVCSLVAYLQPVHSAMFVLVFMFSADVLFGVIADLFVNKRRFSGKKFMKAFFYVAIYLGIVASIFVIGEHMGDANEALFVVKTTTYAFIYFYATNIFRNLTTIFPHNAPIRFLHFIVGLEFTKRIPVLSEFLKQDSEGVKC